MFLKKISQHLSLRRFSSKRIILGIETSCDDTAAACIDTDGQILGHAKHSQQNTHLMFGGIIPPIAQAFHRKNIARIVNETLKNADATLDEIDAIAVTNRPGLQLSLLIGVRYAKHLARQINKPIIPIHHMEAHALTARLNNDIQFPFLSLLISGGHSLLTLVKSVEEFHLLGEHVDDAPGEALDKVARRLKLHYLPEYKNMSGGAAIEKAAQNVIVDRTYNFPLPLASRRDCQFSFAGLKNSAMRAIQNDESKLELLPNNVIPNYKQFCAAFLRASTRHLCHRTQRAIEFCEREGVFVNSSKKTLVVSGGVACNDYIFNGVSHMANNFGFDTVRPEKQYCTDNGVMIAWNGVEKYLINSDVVTNIDKIGIQGKCPLGINRTNDVREAGIKCNWVKVYPI